MYVSSAMPFPSTVGTQRKPLRIDMCTLHSASCTSGKGERGGRDSEPHVGVHTVTRASSSLRQPPTKQPVCALFIALAPLLPFPTLVYPPSPSPPSAPSLPLLHPPPIITRTCDAMSIAVSPLPTIKTRFPL